MLANNNYPITYPAEKFEFILCSVLELHDAGMISWGKYMGFFAS